STNGGQSWSRAQRFVSIGDVYSLVNLGGGVVLAGTYPNGQIYRSTNGGQSWSLVQQLGSVSYVYSLVNLGGGVVLAGTYPNGQIYRSTNGGQSWSLVQQLGSESYVWALADLGGGVVLAGTGANGQIYRSTDGGQSWRLVQQLGSASHVFSLATVQQPTNQPPVANAGPDQQARVNETVYLDGSGSYDPDGDPILGWNWYFVSKPPGSTAEIINAHTSTPSFVPDIGGEYVVELVVSDGALDSQPDQVTIYVTPVDSFVFTELKTYGPRDIFVNTILTTLSVSGSPFARFVPDKAGTYIVGLIVSDGELWSEEDQAVIVVAGPQGTLAEIELSTKVRRDTLSDILLTTWPPHNTFSEVRLTRTVKRDTLCEVRVATKNFVQPEPSPGPIWRPIRPGIG